MWISTLLYFCLCVFAAADSDVRESKIVEIAQGAIRGYKDPEYDIFAFQSIPYATAPTGVNRFKAPLPPPIWQDTLEATDKDIICPQYHIPFLPANKTMQEDCLITNVYVPNTDETNLPVFIHFHGGAFLFGYGDWVQAKKLATEHNIIVVTFNYRLGLTGFLCLRTNDIPGNAGLKDQVELLRWIKKNIASFGGNPNDVTIEGEGAGSGSVDILMLSKLAEGLFTKIIPESGTSNSVFVIQSDPLQNAKDLALVLNFNNVNDVCALEQFYKTATLDMLTSISFMDRHNSFYGFTPCVERSATGAILDDSPVNILKNGHYKKVPILYGFTNMQGLLKIRYFDSWKQKMNEKFSDFLPADLKFESDEQKEEVAKVTKEFYFGDKPIGNDNILAYVDYFSDILFTHSTLRSTKLLVEKGHDQIYLYEYSFVDENTPVVPYTNVRGANHCDQSYTIYESNIPRFSYISNTTEEYKQMASTMREIWANFIKTGKPVPEGSEQPAWPAVRGEWAPHMSLGNSLQLRGSLLKRRADFWEDIYAKYYWDPMPSSTAENELC